jgi:hypothetical protein
MMHELKCQGSPFDAIERGDKRVEFRKNDRGFEVGDYLWLRCINTPCGTLETGYTGEDLVVRVTHIQEDFGIPEGYVAMSIEVFA